MNKKLCWDDTKVFLAIVREGTLSGAAKILKLGIATTYRRLERMEEVLGYRLFIRDQQGYKLTDEGRILVSQAEILEQAGHAFDAMATGVNAGVSGHVRLATAQGLADHLIIPALPKLYSAHPDLTLELVTGVSTINLQRRDADMALRLVRPEQGKVTIRRLGELGFGLYASKSYLQRKPLNKEETMLKNADFIGWPETHQNLPAAKWIEKNSRGKTCCLRAGSMSAHISAVEAGIGMGVLPNFIALTKNLICVRNDIGCNQPIWLVIHSDLTNSGRIRVVADFLSNLVQENQTRLA